MCNRTLPTKDLLEYLNTYIRDTSYFISGSYANPVIGNSNGIYVFFASKADFTTAVLNLKAANIYLYETPDSNINIPTRIKKQITTIKLVKDQFGSPKKVFKSFDLNVCKYAILPNGKQVSHFSTVASIYITNIDFKTFNRVLKHLVYYAQGYFSNNVYNEKYSKKDVKYLLTVVDTYIDNYTILPNYYEKITTYKPVNEIMFKEFSNLPQIKDYLYKKALHYSLSSR